MYLDMRHWKLSLRGPRLSIRACHDYRLRRVCYHMVVLMRNIGANVDLIQSTLGSLCGLLYVLARGPVRE